MPNINIPMLNVNPTNITNLVHPVRGVRDIVVRMKKMYSGKRGSSMEENSPLRYKHAEKHEPRLPGLRLTTRDAEIVMSVYRHRALTTKEVEKLFFAANDQQDASSKA